MNKNKLKKLEEKLNVRQHLGKRVIVLPSHLKDQVKLPPNSLTIFVSSETANKYHISWQKDFEEFKIKKDDKQTTD